MSNKETISHEELRRQIKGNLEIAADTWPLHQLEQLEQSANGLALAGLYAEGLLHNGLASLYNLIYDEQGKIKLTSNPDDEQNIFRVLANVLKQNEEKNKAESTPKSETRSESNDSVRENINLAEHDKPGGFDFF